MQGRQECARYNGWHTDVASNEKALMSAISKQPVSMPLKRSAGFQFYNGGVFSGECGTDDHGVLAVGFGTLSKDMDVTGKNSTTLGRKKKGKAYWKVKNSWGESWGLKGTFCSSVAQSKGWTVRHPQWPSVVPDGVIGCCCAQFEKAAMRLG